MISQKIFVKISNLNDLNITASSCFLNVLRFKLLWVFIYEEAFPDTNIPLLRSSTYGNACFYKRDAPMELLQRITLFF